MSGSGISWAYANLHLAPDRKPCQHPTTLVFYRQDALPAAQPTASKHWRQLNSNNQSIESGKHMNNFHCHVLPHSSRVTPGEVALLIGKPLRITGPQATHINNVKALARHQQLSMWDGETMVVNSLTWLTVQEINQQSPGDINWQHNKQRCNTS